MNDFDEQDELWALLGKAKKNAVSPYFSRNVLRAVRQSSREKPGMLAWLGLRWRVVSLGGIAAVLLALNCATFNKPPAPAAIAGPQIAATVQPVASQPAVPADLKPEDAEVVKHLDELLAYDQNNIWLEDSGK